MPTRAATSPRHRLGDAPRTLDSATSISAADIKLCVDEAVTNAIAHGYDDDSGVVEISVDSDGRELTVVVRDEGKGVDQFQQEGELGFGLKIIDRLTRRYTVSSAPTLGTEVRMIFALSGLLAQVV